MGKKLNTKLDELLAGFGSSEAQIAEAHETLAPLCYRRREDNVVIVLATGQPLNEAWLKENKPHLLPGPTDSPLVKRAFAENNLTARGELVKQVGQAEADRIAQAYGLKSASDTRRGKASTQEKPGEKPNGKATNNPWSKDHFSITEQGRIVKALGMEAAARMAAAAGCKIGDTKPNPNFRPKSRIDGGNKMAIKINRDPKLPALGVDMPVSSTHALAREFEHQAGSNIARAGGRPKTHTTAVHSGMHSRTRGGSLVVGMTQTSLANAPDASGRAPLDPTVPGERLSTPQAVIGHRSRTNNDNIGGSNPGENHARAAGHFADHLAIGKEIMSEAFGASAPDDRMAHGRGRRRLAAEEVRPCHDRMDTRSTRSGSGGASRQGRRTQATKQYREPRERSQRTTARARIPERSRQAGAAD